MSGQLVGGSPAGKPWSSVASGVNERFGFQTRLAKAARFGSTDALRVAWTTSPSQLAAVSTAAGGAAGPTAPAVGAAAVGAAALEADPEPAEPVPACITASG